MEENKKPEEEKLSYEKLAEIANFLQNRVMGLTEQLNRIDNVFKRLDYLFKVMENASRLNKDFVERCAKEIEELMTPVEEENSEEKKEE